MARGLRLSQPGFWEGRGLKFSFRHLDSDFINYVHIGDLGTETQWSRLVGEHTDVSGR